jgi:hypothetical protein
MQKKLPENAVTTGVINDAGRRDVPARNNTSLWLGVNRQRLTARKKIYSFSLPSHDQLSMYAKSPLPPF